MTQEPSRTGPRKRIRKRKRRAVSSSSSSSSSSESSDSATDTSPPKIKQPPPPSKEQAPESSDSESSSDTESDVSQGPPAAAPDVILVDKAIKNIPKRRSPSPSPPPPTIPSFVPLKNDTENGVNKEQILKDRFRKFWMASVADGFKDDLEEIRKEPNLGTSRLTLLIDSLASGAEVFNRPGKGDDINEMEVVLNHSSSNQI